MLLSAFPDTAHSKHAAISELSGWGPIIPAAAGTYRSKNHTEAAMAEHDEKGSASKVGWALTILVSSTPHQLQRGRNFQTIS